MNTTLLRLVAAARMLAGAVRATGSRRGSARTPHDATLHRLDFDLIELPRRA